MRALLLAALLAAPLAGCMDVADGVPAAAPLQVACVDPCKVAFGTSDLTRMHFVRAAVHPGDPAHVAVRLTRQACPADRPDEILPTCPQQTGWPAEATELWVSGDHGATWTQGTLPPAFAADQFGMGFTGDGHLVLALDAGPAAMLVTTSSDGGSTFGAPVVVPLLDPLETASLAADGSCSGGSIPGVAAGVDGVQPLSSPTVHSSPVPGEAVITTYQCISSTAIHMGVLHTTDHGRTWARKPSLPIGASVGYLSLRLAITGTEWTAVSADVDAAFGADSRLVARRSTDQGRTWIAQAYDLPHATTPFWPDLVKDGPEQVLGWFETTEAAAAGYAGSVQRLAYSADGGLTWSSATLDADPGAAIFGGVAWADGAAWAVGNEFVPADNAFVTFVAAMDPEGRVARHDLAVVLQAGPRDVGGVQLNTPAEMAYLVPQPDGVLVVWAASDGRQSSQPTAARFTLA